MAEKRDAPRTENSDSRRRAADARGGACLLLHGIAAEPRQFDGLTEDLDRRGIKWRAPLLPGHGTRYEDLRGITWEDWYETAGKAFDELRGKHGRVSVAGFSIGSLLGLELARRRDVSRMALLNAPLFSFYRFLPQRLFLKVLNLLAREIRTFAPPCSNGNVRTYRRMPVSILNTMAELVKRTKDNLPHVKCPCLIVHSAFDLASRARSARYMLKHLGSSEKCILWLRSREHSILEGNVRHRVIAAVRRFLADENEFYEMTRRRSPKQGDNL